MDTEIIGQLLHDANDAISRGDKTAAQMWLTAADGENDGSDNAIGFILEDTWQRYIERWPR
jgi:hypothetical protein